MRNLPGVKVRVVLWAVVAAVCAAGPAPRAARAQAESNLPANVSARVDRIARQVLAQTGVPSASIAIVRDGRIAYLRAHGQARLNPRTPARTTMRYSIGSISKQFTAAAILLLAEQGKLSLDDPVSKYFPTLTRASEVTIKQLLSHTSGYQDYWPQDYVPPFMTREVTAQDILDRWARKPLDFDPGTKWQYSNTNFVIAGLIFEKVSGTPLVEFLSKKVFEPLGMRSVIDLDHERLGASDPVGYMRYALGPPRVAPKEGKGWLYAAGELAMTVEDLAAWDIAMVEQRVLRPASYKEMQTAVKLKNGEATRYGLGLQIAMRGGHRAVEHGGEVSGFTAYNIVLPDDRAAVVVLTNQDAAGAATQVARRIAPLLFPLDEAAKKQEQALKVFEELQRGRIDRSLLTANANSYFTPQAIRDYAASLGPLGEPDDFMQIGQSNRGGMNFRSYVAAFARKSVRITIYELPDGKIEQFQVATAD
jgi:D-alanyl-D-alanine carboxypeptidase